MSALSTARIVSTRIDNIGVPAPLYIHGKPRVRAPDGALLRHRLPSVTASAVAGDDSGPSNAFSSRNADQLDQLLAGLSELRMKQQQGLIDDSADEGEWDEFEEGEDDIDWVWWRASDDAPADTHSAAKSGAPSASEEFSTSSSTATATSSSSSRLPQQEQVPQRQGQQQQQQGNCAPEQLSYSNPSSTFSSGLSSNTAAGTSSSSTSSTSSNGSSRRVRRTRRVATQ